MAEPMLSQEELEVMKKLLGAEYDSVQAIIDKVKATPTPPKREKEGCKLPAYFREDVFACTMCGNVYNQMRMMKNNGECLSMVAVPEDAKTGELDLRSFFHSVSTCDQCKVKLLELSKEELIEKLLKAESRHNKAVHMLNR